MPTSSMGRCRPCSVGSLLARFSARKTASRDPPRWVSSCGRLAPNGSSISTRSSSDPRSCACTGGASACLAPARACATGAAPLNPWRPTSDARAGGLLACPSATAGTWGCRGRSHVDVALELAPRCSDGARGVRRLDPPAPGLRWATRTRALCDLLRGGRGHARSQRGHHAVTRSGHCTVEMEVPWLIPGTDLRPADVFTSALGNSYTALDTSRSVPRTLSRPAPIAPRPDRRPNSRAMARTSLPSSVSTIPTPRSFGVPVGDLTLTR